MSVSLKAISPAKNSFWDVECLNVPIITETHWSTGVNKWMKFNILAFFLDNLVSSPIKIVLVVFWGFCHHAVFPTMQYSLNTLCPQREKINKYKASREKLKRHGFQPLCLTGWSETISISGIETEIGTLFIENAGSSSTFEPDIHSTEHLSLLPDSRRSIRHCFLLILHWMHLVPVGWLLPDWQVWQQMAAGSQLLLLYTKPVCGRSESPLTSLLFTQSFLCYMNILK